MNPPATCPAGHPWVGDPADCPACTADGDGSSTYDSDLLDELPPPPTSIQGNTKRTPSRAAPAGPRPILEVAGYDLLGELGRGGMGVVYKARHRALNRLVALKVISAGGLAGPRELERFRAEAEAVARLQHPNVVQVFEVGDHDGRPYLALELVEGGTLAQALAATPLPGREAAELVETLARAVHHAHEQGVVHRDLKPGNILLLRDEGGGMRDEMNPGDPSSLIPHPSSLRPKITDFGLAKRLDPDASQSTTGVAVGTPNYMAPEQAAGLNRLVGPAADIYALGSILYECLTGRPPFQGTSAVETLQQVVTADAVPPARLQPSVPRDLETICLVCLRKEPRKRYSSAQALADDLRRFLDGRPIAARRTPPWERAVKWAKRRPALAGLIVVSVLGAGALAGVGVSYYRQLDRHNRELSDANEQILRERDDARRGWAQAERETARAETNLDSASEAVERMLTRVGLQELAAVPHLDPTRARLMEDALEFFNRLIAAQAGDRRLHHKMAQTQFRAGQIHYMLGRLPAAAESLEAALAVVRDLQTDPTPRVSIDTLRELEAKILNQMGLLRRLEGKLPAARADIEAALQIRETLIAAKPRDAEALYQLVIGYTNLSAISRTERRKDERLTYLSRALTRAEELMALTPATFFARDAYSTVLNHLGLFQLDHRQADRGLEVLEKALEIRRALAKEQPGEVHGQADLGTALSNAATARRENGYLRRAVTLYAEALAIREKLAADHPDVAPWAIDVANTLFHMGELSRAKGDHESAEDWYTKAIARVAGRDDDPRARAVLRDAHAYRGEARDQLGRHADAADDLKRAAELGDGPDRAVFRVRRALVMARFRPPKEAADAVEAVLRDIQPFGELLFDSARAFAVAGKREMDRKMAEAYLRRSVELLTHAQRLGFFQTADGAGQLDKHPDLAPLRGRADFKSLAERVG
jgi:serine/threonine protein kinase